MGNGAMPIDHMITDETLSPDERHVLSLAFNSALRKLELVDRDDPICAIIAQRMIDIHKRGVRDAVALCEITIREIGVPR
jgi:hypothetical protein